MKRVKLIPTEWSSSSKHFSSGMDWLWFYTEVGFAHVQQRKWDTRQLLLEPPLPIPIFHLWKAVSGTFHIELTNSVESLSWHYPTSHERGREHPVMIHYFTMQAWTNNRDEEKRFYSYLWIEPGYSWWKGWCTDILRRQRFRTVYKQITIIQVDKMDIGYSFLTS